MRRTQAQPAERLRRLRAHYDALKLGRILRDYLTSLGLPCWSAEQDADHRQWLDKHETHDHQVVLDIFTDEARKAARGRDLRDADGRPIW